MQGYRAPESFLLIDEGKTWAEFIAGLNRTSSYGVGATTGRVYWYLYSQTISGYNWVYSGYLKDSNGNYVLGTDVMKKGTYTYYNDDDKGVAPLP